MIIPYHYNFLLFMLKINLPVSHFREVWNEENIKLNLIRGVSVIMRQKISQLISIIHLLSFSHERDFALWL
jgi:hypothetical protein